MANDTFRILCLDGGGIRGVFAASILAAIEERRLGGEPLVANCDLIAGTSTGALIALALAFGASPREICEFYHKRGQAIFGNDSLIASWPRALKRIVFAPYSSEALEGEIENLIGRVSFGDASKRLVLPSYNADLGNIHVFKYLFPKDRVAASDRGYRREDYDRFDSIRAAQVGAASSAAPTFFPARSVAFDIPHFYLDGGIWANSPVMPALAEAIGPLGIDLRRVRVLSVGTRFEPIAVGTWRRVGGLLPWNVGVINLLMNAQAAGAVGTARWMLGKGCFLRLDEPQGTKDQGKYAPMSFDDVRSIPDLIRRGGELVDQRASEIEQFLQDWHAGAPPGNA